MFGDFLSAWMGAGLRYFVAVALILPLELMAPRGKVSLKSRLQGVVIALVLMTPATILFNAVQGGLLPIEPIVPLAIWQAHPILEIGLALFAFDFFYYVMHRIAHRFFWRIHGVHHSVEELSAINAYNHPLHIAIDWAGIFLPMTLLGLQTGLIVSALIQAQGYWLHSATRVNFGPLRWLLNDNRYHRIHHSLEERHWHKNFALIFPLWDLVFGTAHMSEPHAWTATGVPDMPEAKTLSGYLALPFRSRRLFSNSVKTKDP